MHTDDSVLLIDLLLMWPLPETALDALRNYLVGAMPYKHYVMRSFPLCGVKVLHPAQIIELDRQPCRRPKHKKHPGCLAHAAIGVILHRRC